MGGPENSGFPLSPQDQYENYTYRVVKEFEEGQEAYGHEGLCVRAVLTEEGQARLTLMGADAKGKVTKEVVLAEHCAEVDVKAKKPRPLFDFKRQSFEKKLRILGRCGMTDVLMSAPLEPVVAKNFKPEGGPYSLVDDPP